jgi:hypothetical protein
MSALGQKQTSRGEASMSALPLKADIPQSTCDVCFVTWRASFDHLVGSNDHRCRYSQTYGSCGLEIDDKFEFGRLLHG